jgi:sulfonate transport system permease protein
MIMANERGNPSKLWAARVLLAAVVLGLWEFAVRKGEIDDFWVSRPSAIATTLWRFFSTGYIYPHLLVTLEEALLGLIAGAVGGVALGFILARFDFFGRVVNPFIFFLYSIPRIALAPLFVLWFGIGLTSKVFTIFVIVFFLLLVNTVTGIRNVDPHLVRGLKAMGATRMQVARMVTLPSTLVWILAGLQIAIPNSVIGAVIGEYVGATRGLGYVILFASSNLDTTTLLAAITVLGVISVAISRATSYAETRLLRWRVAMPAV